ncbi:hypothetical protein ALP73_01099 [Pseudomonas coronafaciens pv. garcae]|uniref:hypothetical protein n=1 Tax=Pseudomonas syringae group TaxID=136849 RepID=UPI000EFDD38F|nr:hypothetical protein [Pseudomonas coronafaciens]RMS09323.1 hypothetical protein ALP73_01099 [Pseudomonas coronafaciens pv. garcae]
MATTGSKKGTSNTHIGFERFEKLTDAAIGLSFKIGKQITPSQLNQYLLDNFMDKAVEKYVRDNPKQ